MKKSAKTILLCVFIAVALLLAFILIPKIIQHEGLFEPEYPAAVTSAEESGDELVLLTSAEPDEKPEQTPEPEPEAEPEAEPETVSAPEPEEEPVQETVDYRFRNKKLLNSHFEKHGIEMGFDTAAEYEAAASAVVNNKDALHKTEKEDGDDVYYLEDTNEFVIVSQDGYIRTYFNPSDGIRYYNRQ